MLCFPDNDGASYGCYWDTFVKMCMLWHELGSYRFATCQYIDYVDKRLC